MLRIAAALTLLMIILKEFGIITWSWWIVMSPLIAVPFIWLAILILVAIFGIKVYKRNRA